MVSGIKCEYCGALESDCFGNEEEHKPDCPKYIRRC